MSEWPARSLWSAIATRCRQSILSFKEPLWVLSSLLADFLFHTLHKCALSWTADSKKKCPNHISAQARNKYPPTNNWSYIFLCSPASLLYWIAHSWTEAQRFAFLGRFLFYPEHLKNYALKLSEEVAILEEIFRNTIETSWLVNAIKF